MKRIPSFRGETAHVLVVIQSSADIIESIKNKKDKLPEGGDLMLCECDYWLKAACKTLDPPFWWIYRSYLVFDGVWKAYPAT